MKMHKNRMASLMWFALFSVLLITGCHDPSTDTIEILGEEKSPNGKFIATSFSCAGEVRPVTSTSMPAFGR